VLAGGPGFEPRPLGPEPRVLPLNYPPVGAGSGLAASAERKTLTGAEDGRSGAAVPRAGNLVPAGAGFNRNPGRMLPRPGPAIPDVARWRCAAQPSAAAERIRGAGGRPARTCLKRRTRRPNGAGPPQELGENGAAGHSPVSPAFAASIDFLGPVEKLWPRRRAAYASDSLGPADERGARPPCPWWSCGKRRRARLRPPP
jgi:hypothetical protein